MMKKGSTLKDPQQPYSPQSLSSSSQAPSSILYIPSLDLRPARVSRPSSTPPHPPPYLFPSCQLKATLGNVRTLLLKQHRTV